MLLCSCQDISHFEVIRHAYAGAGWLPEVVRVGGGLAGPAAARRGVQPQRAAGGQAARSLRRHAQPGRHSSVAVYACTLSVLLVNVGPEN